MRPRANTISHVDGSAMHMMASATAAAARGLPAHTHSRHASLVGLPVPAYEQHSFAGMAAAMGQRGMAHGLPKLDTHGLNTSIDFGASGLRTAPPMAVFSPEMDFENYLFGPATGSTINPNALHYNDSPQAMTLDATSPGFPHNGLPNMTNGQPLEDGFDWLTGFEHQMSFQGANEAAVDESSPSAMSTTSQSGISDVMLDGSNHRSANAAAAAAAASAAATTSMWQPAVMAPMHMASNAFAMDGPAIFPDLLSGAPLSPQQVPPKSMGEAYFSTPPPSINSVSPSVVPVLGQHQINQTQQQQQQYQHMLNGGSFGFAAGPETPTSMNGSNHGTSPVSTITDSTRNAILGALSASQQPAQHSARKFSFPASAAAHLSPLSPTSHANDSISSQTANNTSAAAADPTSQLPSTQDLQRYVGSYLRYFHPHLPFLHLPTLSLDVPARSASSRTSGVGSSGCLTLSMAAIGALYELEHKQSRELFDLAKKMIQLYLEEVRKANVRKADFRRPSGAEHNGQQHGGQQDHSNDTPVWLVQAMLLNVVYGHNCGDKRASEIASTHCAALVRLAQEAELFRPIRIESFPEPDLQMGGAEGGWNGAVNMEFDDRALWLRWKAMEERKRTLYAIFILSSLLVTAYNHVPALTNSEILLDLPCDEEFFSADSPATFFAKGGVAAANHNRLRFHDALGDLLRTNEKQQKLAMNGAGPHFGENHLRDLRPSTFGCLVLINALHNYIWETRQRHHNKVWTNEETEKMHRHIEPALKAWQAAWASNPQHSLERPNPFGAGPISADAIPLLDLAYVRLFVNLSRSKEKFWERDWDGMAEELARGSEIVQHAEQSPGSNAENSALQGDVAMHSEQSAKLAALSKSGVGAQPDFGSSVVSPTMLQANGAALTMNGLGGPQNLAQSPMSNRGTSRREKHLRKAAFCAADSLAMSDKLGVTFADFTSRELPLQSAMCAFDCAQVLAEWVASLQDRVGRYLGILGHDEIDLSQVPAIMLLEDEDVKLLGKVQEVLGNAEMKLNADMANGQNGNGMTGLGINMPNVDIHGTNGEQNGYAAKILKVTAYMLDKAAVWPGKRDSSCSLVPSVRPCF
jgi:hypothetical protein